MRSIKKIVTDKKEIEEIKGLVEVYEEISATKMQEVEEEIMMARDFFERLASLSSEVGTDLEKAGLGRNGDVAVFVSAQTGLYGDLVDRIFMSFVNFVSKNPGMEKVVIGRLGDTMMKSMAKGIDYKYYDMKNEKVEEENLSLLVKELIRHKKIYMFYGKFNNIVSQETWTTSVSGQVLGEIQDQTFDKNKFLYLYEPTIDAVSKVFSEEIAGLVFDQTISESQLAKYASRLMYLDAALEKIDDKLTGLSMEKNKAVKRNNERKQLVSMAGIISL